MSKLTQQEHSKINASEYPGTRQLCTVCGQPTGRCEEDSIFDCNGCGPLCELCSDDNLDVHDL